MEKPMEKKRLDVLVDTTMPEQAECFELAMEKLEDEDFLIINEACKKLVARLQYANIKTRIEYKDGLEILAKLGFFLLLNEKKKRR